MDDEVQEVGGFFQRVGAVRDDDAVNVALLGQCRDALAEGDEVLSAWGNFSKLKRGTLVTT